MGKYNYLVVDKSEMDFTELKTGKIIECQVCHNGHYVTDCKDAFNAHSFYCDMCGDKIMLETGIDLLNL